MRKKREWWYIIVDGGKVSVKQLTQTYFNLDRTVSKIIGEFRSKEEAEQFAKTI